MAASPSTVKGELETSRFQDGTEKTDSLLDLRPPRSGYARLALEALHTLGVRQRLVLVATSDKWDANKYGIKQDDVLFLGRCDIHKELRKRGGAELVICESLSAPVRFLISC